MQKTKVNKLWISSIIFLSFCVQSCTTEKNSINEYSNFPYKGEITINDSCIYLLHSGGYVGETTIIQLNPLRNRLNTTLVEFDSYSLNGHSLHINKNYSFHLENLNLPSIEVLQKPNLELIQKYSMSDSIVSYFDYTFYMPKTNKLCWINTHDGIDEDEQVVLKWIEKNITKISIKEDINYRLLTENKISFTDINRDSLERQYILPQDELTGIPRFFRER